MTLRAEKDVPQVPIATWVVIPTIPRAPKDWADFKEDLKQIGCHKLMKQSWNLKDEGMVQELITEVSNHY